MMLNGIACLIAIMYLITAVNTAHILGLFPYTAKSHFICNHAILKSLHDNGHQVTMVAPFTAAEEKLENFTYIAPPTSAQIFISSTPIDTFDNVKLGLMLMDWGRILVNLCYDVMEILEIQEAMRGSEKLYDVIFAEYLFDLDCYLPIAEKLGIPLIGTVTTRSYQWADKAIGISTNPAAIPINMWSPGGTEMTFSKRLLNSWNYLIIEYYSMYTRRLVDEFYQKYFVPELTYKKTVSFIFYNDHASILPHLSVPNAASIAGISVTQAKPLPRDIQKFIDEASRGVILFSLGSTIRASSMSMEQRTAFINAFSSIPQRVIWKYEEPIENLPDNIMIKSWLPQRDILEHKNVIVFMSHCGQGSMYEAIVTSTPVVTMPIFGDQRANADLLINRKTGVSLNLQTVTRETVLETLNVIINDTGYYERMQEMSHVFRNRPITPEESIVFWTEYVIRYNGAPHLRALGADMPFYKYFMLDIAALFVFTLSFILFVTYIAVRKIYLLVLQRLENVEHVNKNK